MTRSPADIARRLSARGEPRDSGGAAISEAAAKPIGAFARETFRLPRDKARDTAREWFERYPKAAYMTQVESWRVLDDGLIEFTMRRLPTAD